MDIGPDFDVGEAGGVYVKAGRRTMLWLLGR